MIPPTGRLILRLRDRPLDLQFDDVAVSKAKDVIAMTVRVERPGADLVGAISVHAPLERASDKKGRERRIAAGDAEIMPFIHQTPEWPDLTWDADAVTGQLPAVRHWQGRLLGRIEGLGFALQSEASLATLTGDVVKSSAIEGEVLDPGQVRSSIARRLGLDVGGYLPANRDIEGIVEVMLDATQHHDQPPLR